MEHVSVFSLMIVLCGIGTAICAYAAFKLGKNTKHYVHKLTLLFALVMVILAFAASIEQSANEKKISELNGKVLQLSTDLRAELTGGDSYTTVDLIIPSEDKEPCCAVIYNHGDEVVYDLEITILNLTEIENMDPFLLLNGGTETMEQTFRIGNVNSKGYFQIDTLSLNRKQIPTKLKVFFRARNGVWHELLTCRKVDGRWTTEILLKRNGEVLYSSHRPAPKRKELTTGSRIIQ